MSKVAELDPVIHVQARLRIMSTLVMLDEGDQIIFPRLQKILDMTPGNLSTHLLKLEKAGYVKQEKSFSGRTPTTLISLTNAGRAAFENYTNALKQLLGESGK